MRIIDYPTRDAWLVARRSGLGGSDVPAVLGLSRWQTPLNVWLSKVGLSPSQDGATYSQERGSFMEPFIATRLAAEAGLRIDRTEGYRIVRHEAHECLAYSPDGFARPFIGEDAVLSLCEFKSHLGTGAKDSWAEGVPADVAAQAQHGMDVCGLAMCFVAVDLGTEFRWARLARDDAWIAETRPRLLDFWKLVETETPPPPTADDKDALSILYPRETGEVKPLAGELLDAAWELDGIADKRKELETREALLQNRVRAALGDASRGVLADGTGFSWSTQSRAAMVPDPNAPRSEFRVLRRFGRKKEAS